MQPSHSYALIALLLLTLLNAFFTLAEIALNTVRNARLQDLIEAGGQDAGAAGSAQQLLRQPTLVVATVQVGINLASFGVAAIAAAVLAPDWAHSLPPRLTTHPVRVMTVLLTLVTALFTIVIGEIIPRSVALRQPDQMALLIARPLRFFIVFFAPLATVALGLSNLLVRPFGLTATFAAPMITEEELRAMLEASAQSGAIEEDEKEIIRNVISFGDTDVRQVMTPRIDVKAIDVGAGLPALLDLIVESGHSRIPVYENSVDTIVGIVHAKDLLPALARGERALDLRPLMRFPLIVPENRRVDDLLDEFRGSSVQMAIVQDEYGGTAGLVTVEDLLEELVGEIQDEYDQEDAQFQTLEPGVYRMDARMAIDDLNDLLALNLPHDDFDTIGGFVFGQFGRQPDTGESVCYENLEFIVEKTDGRRVDQIKLIVSASGTVSEEE
ncbi:MAG: hemolysin family protein [Janthinobacterium lividum]